MLSDIGRDMVYAFRMLQKNPGFTAVAVITLALGIGANTTVFSVVEAIFNFPLPVDDPQRVSFVFAQNLEHDIDQNATSVDDFLDWQEQSDSFEYLVAGTGRPYNVIGAGEPVRVRAFDVTAGFFPAIGAHLQMGRPFRQEESQPGGERVTVVSHSLWQQQFGGDPDVLGQSISLDGISHTVVGVTEEEFFFPNPNTALWTPLAVERGRASRDERTVLVLGRLKPGVTPDMATAEMRTIAKRIEDAHPDTNEGWSASVITIRDNMLSGAGFAMILLYGSITFVLLIACANVANLLLARATVREKEMALRSTLGAARFRVVRQLLTESVALSFVGGILGLLIGFWGMNILRNMVAPDVNIGFIADYMVLNSTMLFHTLTVSVLAGVLFGLVPALQISKPDLHDTLKEGGRGGSGGRRRRTLRNVLVVAQVALALALLGTAGALIRAFDHIYTADPGFDTKDLLTMRLTLPESDYGEPQQVVAFYREAAERLAQIPGVEAVATTTTLPLTLFPGATTSAVSIEGAQEEVDLSIPTAVDLVVGPSFFGAMKISLEQGRGITEGDDENTLPVAVVSQSMVRRYWAETDPIGRRFKLGVRESENPWLTVVGVTDDVQIHSHSLRFSDSATPIVFLPYAQNARREMSFALRTAVEPTSVAPSVRSAIWEVDPNQPVDDVMTMDQVLAQFDTQNLFFVRISTGLAVIALVLAGVGIYGVISYTVHHRAHEIGIRLALGAKPRSIVYLVLRQGLALTVIGLFLGLGGAVFIVRSMGSQLEGLNVSNAASPLTFMAVSLVLLVVAQFASYMPARRAIRVDPVETLRHE
jgi:putative ABC transport system permease protein